jgi:hypothetical protein
MNTRLTIATLLAGTLWGHATVLTFNMPNGPINQAYGDRVTNSIMDGFTYGVAEGFTPNVVVSYGPTTPIDADVKVLSPGYGTLTKALYPDRDEVGRLEVTLTADPGYGVRLHSWDMAAFTTAFTTNPMINELRVVVDGTNAALLTNVEISRTDRTSFDYSASPFIGQTIVLMFDAVNLYQVGWEHSDDIAFGNIVISQPATGVHAAIRVSQVEISWACEAGKNYQVQYRTDANPPDVWLNLGSPVAGTGSTCTASDSAPIGQERRFYRVLEQ